MSTDKQLRANRANAQKSTGPKTAEGKARAAANSQRHGFCARTIVLPEENNSEFLELLDSLVAEYQPIGPTETFLVREMATREWFIRRHARLEAGVYATRLRVMRRQEYNTDEPDDYGPQQERTEDEVAQDDDTRLMGQACFNVADGDAFVKLTRYRNSARRTLRATQERRRNPPPRNLPSEPNSQQPPAPSTDAPVLSSDRSRAPLAIADQRSHHAVA